MLYLILVWLHVTAAAIAIGTNATYGLWFARARANPEVLPFTLDTVKRLDDRLANPMYGAVALTGVLLVWIGPYSFTTPWIMLTTIIFVAIAAVGFGVFTPSLKRQIELVQAGQLGSPEYRALAKRGAVAGPVLGVLVIFILFLMVVQPTLWG